MLEYVKICPKCGHVNPEDVDTCAKDSEFLGFVTPVPATSVKDNQRNSPAVTGTFEVPTDQTPSTHTPNSQPDQQSVPVTMRFEDQPVFYLELMGSERVYELRSGWIIGQAHPTSLANVQLSDIPGVNFIHRQHCRFEYSHGQWFVTAIGHQSFTNPTFVNQQKLAPNQSCVIKNGDRLTLGNITFTVRIIAP